MRTKTLALSFFLLTTVSLADSSVDKMVGTWHLGPEGLAPPDENVVSAVIKVEKIGLNTLHEESDQTLKSGKTQHLAMTRVCDGAEHKVTDSPIAVSNQVSFTCDPNTYNFVVKNHGKMVLDVKTNFSADGRTVTYHRKRLDKDGHWVEDTRVWKKQ